MTGTRPHPVLLTHHLSEPYSGSDLSLLAVARGLDRRRFLPAVLIPPGPMKEKYREAGLRVWEVPMAPLRRSWSPLPHARYALTFPFTVRAIRRVLREFGAELVYVNTSLHLHAPFAARSQGVPIVWHIRELWNTSPLLVRIIRRMATRVVANSNAVREGLRIPEAVVIHNGVDDQSARPPSSIRREFPQLAAAPLIVMAARIDTSKGHAVFLRSASIVHNRYPKARFVVVGGPVYSRPGLVDQLKALAVSLGLREALVFAGPRDDVPAVLREAAVVVCSSTEPESFGRVVIEAMEAGRPVIASDQGGHRETVVGNETGYLVPPSDPAALAERLSELLADPDRADQLGKAGRRRYEAHFTLERMVSRMANVFEDAIAEACHSGHRSG